MPFFVFALLALVGVNVWATRRVLAVPDNEGVPKRLLVAGIWIIPFMGALIARSHTRSAPASTPHGPVGHSTTSREEAPEKLNADGAAAAFDVLGNLGAVGNIPLMNWDSLRAWSSGMASTEEVTRAIDAGRRAWLLHLRDACLPNADLHATEEAYILSTLDPQEVKAMARYVATAKRRITSVLGNLARFPAGERSIVIVLDNQEDYYNYVSVYYPDEGEFSFSGGMFIDAGCPHFVVVRDGLATIEPVIAHELTHSALSYLRLPKWLDEGLAVNTEHRVAGVQPGLHTPQELHAMHQRFWDAQRIQEFWTGASFDRTDEGNLLSYDLARIMVSQLGRQWDNFTGFVSLASREDGGQRAAHTSLSISLGTYAATLLEVSDANGWDPEESDGPIRAVAAE